MVSGNAIIKFCLLLVRQRRRIRFKALPQHVKQFKRFGSGKVSDFALQVGHEVTPIPIYFCCRTNTPAPPISAG